MRRTRWTTVLACFAVPGLLTWVVLDLTWRHRGWVPPLTIWGAAIAVVITVVVLMAGLAVRRLKAGERTWITPTGAATTAVAAQASVRVGAAVAGVYAAELVVALAAAPSPVTTGLAWHSGGCLAACLAWAGIGLLVESWCAIDASDDDSHQPSTSSGDAAPA